MTRPSARYPTLTQKTLLLILSLVLSNNGVSMAAENFITGTSPGPASNASIVIVTKIILVIERCNTTQFIIISKITINNIIFQNKTLLTKLAGHDLSSAKEVVRRLVDGGVVDPLLVPEEEGVQKVVPRTRGRQGGSPPLPTVPCSDITLENGRKKDEVLVMRRETSEL